VGWAQLHSELRLGVLFTPWGEALIRPAYREAMVRLSRLPHLRRVAAQTNLAFAVDGLREADPQKAALWCTYHPSQTSQKRFLAQCAALSALGIRYSVGMVGLREHFDEIAAMRRALPRSVYLWVNAYKREPGYYAPDEARRLEAVDPWFGFNLREHPSRGRSCRAGQQAITVDARGVVRRCHFIAEPLGNLYQDDLATMLAPRPCTRPTCGCHIGYVHLEELALDQVFGDGILERIPLGPRGRRLPLLASPTGG
jgi:hypothetical protein